MLDCGRHVMVTHADEPLGRRLVKRLYFDEDVREILAVGAGPPPRGFDAFLRGSGGRRPERLRYARVDLTRHRPVRDLFHSEAFRRAKIDSVIHVPTHAPYATPGEGSRPPPAGVPHRTAEARLVLRHCLETASIRHLITIGSAFVYRLEPGNANRFTEASELDLDAEQPTEARSWIDCDMLFHGEVHNPELEVTLLRVPTVVGRGGTLFLHPALGAGAALSLRPMGFDPLCALVADQDVARAARLALRRRARGIYNIAGREQLPLSVLAGWSGNTSLPLPGPLLRGLAGAAHALGAEGLHGGLSGAHLRYGFTLDTTRAESELGFRPGYRIGLGAGSDGRFRIESSAC
jgi:nucleoside-diphosphate-sugar epimerase